jgi:iron complex transport system permease protein
VTASVDAVDPRSRRRAAAVTTLAVTLLVVVMLGLLSGAVAVSPADLFHMLAQRLGISDDAERLTDSVLWAIRLPRVLAGAVVGSGLGAAGAALQGTFRNHMADPHLVGISPAAGLGAVLGIAVTPIGGPPLIMMVGAATAGAVAALTMRRIAKRIVESNQFILIGLALGLGMLAWLGAIVLAWDSPRVPTFTFWVFGGLAGSTWSTLGAGTPVVLLGLATLVASARSLDLLALGETEAQHLGLNVDRVIAVVLVGVGVAVGGAVGLGGAIGFVGLIVPLLLRRWIGPGHRWLIPVSALAGAAMVVAVDILARTIASPVEIPVGLLTAILGAPVFIWFLLRVGRVRS